MALCLHRVLPARMTVLIHYGLIYGKAGPARWPRLSFDAMAMISVVARNKPPRWRAALVSDSGFNGFSGAYRLYPDGSNRRAFELRQIGSGVSTLFRSAPDKL